MAAHPVRQLFDAGVMVTVNSDDLFFFGNGVSEEHYALHQGLAFFLEKLAKVAGNGFEVALLRDSKRQSFRNELAVFCENQGLAC